ncbi:hypothetical protein WG66_007767 [Moniliophthora roreri]|nr:hypothetical protein WG66_007767 [Moniliophthora roreri]
MPTNPNQRDQNTSSNIQHSQIAIHRDISGARHAEVSQTQTIPVSQGFGPDVVGTERPPPNIILVSKDSVSFYTDEYTLLRLSNNNFNGLLPLPSQASVNRMVFLKNLPSSELKIVLHAIYVNVPITSSGNSLDDFQLLARGIGWLPTFGIPVKSVILPRTPLFNRMLSFAPLHSVEVYSLAGHHDMNDLAVTASSHTLSVDLASLKKELAKHMGPTYLLRLLRLHRIRQTTLLSLLAKAPDSHSETEECRSEDQQVLKGEWNTSVGFLIGKVNAGTVPGLIREAVMSHTSSITCKDCTRARDARLNAVLAEWSATVRSV